MPLYNHRHISSRLGLPFVRNQTLVALQNPHSANITHSRFTIPAVWFTCIKRGPGWHFTGSGRQTNMAALHKTYRYGFCARFHHIRLLRSNDSFQVAIVSLFTLRTDFFFQSIWDWNLAHSPTLILTSDSILTTATQFTFVPDPTAAIKSKALRQLPHGPD